MSMENIEVQKDDKIVIIKISGEFDTSAVNAFSRSLNDETDEELDGIILDMENVSYVDSAALGVLINLIKKAKKGDKKNLVILKPQEKVENILEEVGLTKFLVIESSFEAAKKKILS